MSQKKIKKSFVKPAIGAVAALAIIGAFVPSESNSKIEQTTQSTIVEEIKDSEKIAEIVEVDTKSNPEEKTNQNKYVGSSESDKYHNQTCRWADAINKENLVYFDTKEDAASDGYFPCGTCKP